MGNAQALLPHLVDITVILALGIVYAAGLAIGAVAASVRDGLDRLVLVAMAGLSGEKSG